MFWSSIIYVYFIGCHLILKLFQIVFYKNHFCDIIVRKKITISTMFRSSIMYVYFIGCQN